MNKFLTYFTIAAMVAAGCKKPAEPENAGELGWLMGCWQTEDAGTVERWQAGSSTHYFGSSVTLQNEETVFFEHMRLEASPAGLKFFAYPNGEGPSQFNQTQLDFLSFTVENAAHDYPQKITYKADGDGLKAVISRMDGSDPNSWEYERCSQ